MERKRERYVCVTVLIWVVVCVVNIFMCMNVCIGICLYEYMDLFECVSMLVGGLIIFA